MNLIAALFLLFAATAQSSRALQQVQIITPRELLAKIADVSIIDARDQNFSKAHIPGSQSVHWKDWTLETPSLWNYLFGHSRNWGKVPENNSSLQNRIEMLGISNTREIVVVGEPHGWGEEGRFAWLFLYWGAEKVSLLDGGFSAWQKLGLPVENGEAKKPVRGHFRIKLVPQRRVILSEVEANLRTHARPLFDARSALEYGGTTVTAQKRGGHIPGALSLPIDQLYLKDGTYIDAASLKRLSGAETGIPITYCVGGIRSALLAVLLEARLGEVAANYDASIWEWSDEPSLPLEK